MKYLILNILVAIFLSGMIPTLSFSAAKVSVSGISSGAFMALQLMVLSSTEIETAVVLAGGPPQCARVYGVQTIQVCMKSPEKIDVEALVKSGLQHNLTANNIKKKIVLYHGTQDGVVKPVSATKTQEFLLSLFPNWLVDVRWLNNGVHAWPTENYGLPCGTEESPWMNQCQQGFASMIMEEILMSPQQPQEKVEQGGLQKKSWNPPWGSHMSSDYWLYSSKACEQQSCDLHVALHGCGMGEDQIADTFVQNSGLNSWAQANNVKILYPQIKTSLVNPYGCWDWFGYTGFNYDQDEGPQIRALVELIQKHR